MVVIHWENTNYLFCSSRVAARGIAIADAQADELYGNTVPGSSQVQSSAITEIPSSSASGASLSVLSRLKEKFNQSWLYAVQRWPVVYLSS